MKTFSNDRTWQGRVKLYKLEWYYYWKLTTTTRIYVSSIQGYPINITTIHGRAEQSCRTYRKITTTTHIYLINIGLSKNFATIQGRAEESCITWSGITIRKISPPHMCLINIQLFHTYCHNQGQGRSELYKLPKPQMCFINIELFHTYCQNPGQSRIV